MDQDEENNEQRLFCQIQLIREHIKNKTLWQKETSYRYQLFRELEKEHYPSLFFI